MANSNPLMAGLPSPRTSQPPKRLRTKLAVVPLALCVVAGCTTSGTGTGASNAGAPSATFAWKAGADASRGTMTATLTDGEAYQGPFFQVTHETTSEELGPLWTGWGGHFGGWRGWDTWGPSEGYATEYTGKVLANLQGPKGYMRCKFTLMQPSAGMSGGGEGRCQYADGTIINAQFPPG